LDTIPPSASGTNALTVRYLRTPTDMTSVDSTFDFPDEWDSAIVNCAIARCRYSDRDAILSSTEMARYDAMRQTVFQINRHKLMGDAS